MTWRSRNRRFRKPRRSEKTWRGTNVSRYPTSLGSLFQLSCKSGRYCDGTWRRTPLYRWTERSPGNWRISSCPSDSDCNQSTSMIMYRDFTGGINELQTKISLTPRQTLYPSGWQWRGEWIQRRLERGRRFLLIARRFCTDKAGRWCIKLPGGWRLVDERECSSHPSLSLLLKPWSLYHRRRHCMKPLL